MAEGYAKIAMLMGEHNELGIFRGFRTLNMQSLLYQQAEITFLESRLQSLVQSNPGNSGQGGSTSDWWLLANSDHDGVKEVWGIVQQIQMKLEKYNSTIAHLSYILKLPKFASYDIQFFRDWLERPNMGNFPLVGRDRNAWAEQTETDLVALCARSSDDIFSKWFTDKLIPWFHNLVWKRFKEPLPNQPLSEISQYSEPHLQLAISILATVVASILPLSSIVVLNFVLSQNTRLGIIVVFAALFSFFLALLTQGRRIEIFAATSAFAAVQVVFLANYNGNNSQCSR